MAFYRQTAGKHAVNTVTFRADWPRPGTKNPARADDWSLGDGFLVQQSLRLRFSDLPAAARFLDPRTRDGFRRCVFMELRSFPGTLISNVFLVGLQPTSVN